MTTARLIPSGSRPSAKKAKFSFGALASYISLATRWLKYRLRHCSKAAETLGLRGTDQTRFSALPASSRAGRAATAASRAGVCGFLAAMFQKVRAIFRNIKHGANE